MANIRAVMVGAGGIAAAWFGPLKAEGVEIVGVVDLNLERAQWRVAEQQLTCEASDNLRKTLKKTRPDLVLDLTVPEAHCQVTCTALKAGCHVISEKPMASSMAEARRMVATAEKTGKLYVVSQNRRWDALPERVRQVVAGQMFGQLTTLNCDFFLGAHFGGFRDEMPSPLILDMAIHHFDMARFFSGSDPIAVYAREFNPAGSWYKGDVAATCVFEMTNNVLFTYRGSWCAEGFHTGWQGDWRVIGSRGTVLYEKDGEIRGQVVAGDDGFNRPLKDIEIPPTTLKQFGQHQVLRQVLDFMETGKMPVTECHDNIKSLAMVFAAIESAKKGRRVPVRI